MLIKFHLQYIKIIESKADIQTFKVEVGHKNALDFQLSSYLGYLLKKSQPKNMLLFPTMLALGHW